MTNVTVDGEPDTIDGHPVKDGWLLIYSWKRQTWKRWMRVKEWEARKAAVARINDQAMPLKERKQILEEERKRIRKLKRQSRYDKGTDVAEMDDGEPLTDTGADE